MMKTNKPGLLIMYDYFYPAYKAGGPIQSLTNLAIALQEEYNISILTSAYDLNDDHILENIKPDSWSEVKLTDSSATINVWYATNGQIKPGLLKKIIKQVKPATVYLNGMFSFRFLLIPLLTIKNVRLLICPRGMLQEGALAGKAFKKRIFLSLIKLLGLINKVSWHATNEEEETDIKQQFPKHDKIFVAGNIPKRPLQNIHSIKKEKGILKLVYLSLITEKKNLEQAIKIIAGIENNITLDIYGPVKDDAYWKKCIEIIKLTNGRVQYKGTVLPEKVQSVFSNYHASIFLTKGENFGHALYESLSTGCPVITSYFTPWNNLTEKYAGWNVDLTNEKNIITTLKEIYDMDQQTYSFFAAGSYKLANEYYQKGFSLVNYKEMFYNAN